MTNSMILFDSKATGKKKKLLRYLIQTESQGKLRQQVATVMFQI